MITISAFGDAGDLKQVKAGLDAGINIINEITGRTRPLVGDEPEYYAMFNHFDL